MTFHHFEDLAIELQETIMQLLTIEALLSFGMLRVL